MSLYTALLRPLLFCFDAERVHHSTVEACRAAGRVPLVPTIARACFEYAAPELESEVAGLRFPNPVGLAAGWDKSGRALRMLDHLGFGFAEIGSVSARPSAGNPKPRLFRLPQDRAIVVNYGLPNDGAEIVARRLAAYRSRTPRGVNIVKTNTGPEGLACTDDEILADYETSAGLLHRHASYLTLNLSCPNARAGEDFFAVPGSIARLLERLCQLPLACPVFLKIAPNPDPAAIERLIEEVNPFERVQGFIFNLPSGKPEPLLMTTPRAVWDPLPGAIAGPPVEQLINTCIRELYTRMPRRRFAIIGAGGIENAADAYRKIGLGASLVQVYTAMIYEGPGLVKRVNRDLTALLKRDGFKRISEAVGCSNPRS